MLTLVLCYCGPIPLRKAILFSLANSIKHIVTTKATISMVQVRFLVLLFPMKIINNLYGLRVACVSLIYLFSHRMIGWCDYCASALTDSVTMSTNMPGSGYPTIYDRISFVLRM